MFGSPQSMGYDRAITIFSPDGRLFQVEYAIEAVRRGTTAIGAKCNEGVVFVVERRQLPLQENIGSEKIFKIDDHVGVAIAGLTADARTLVEQARVHAQVNILSYNEKVSILETTRDLCDQMQLYTQNAGVRPFGVAMMVGGIDPDDGTKLFMTDPSGAFWGYHATAIGAGAPNAREFLQKEYKPEMTLEDIKVLLLKALKGVVEGDLDENRFEMCEIKSSDRTFRMLDVAENKAILGKL
jgi:proteasome alpha subunit